MNAYQADAPLPSILIVDDTADNVRLLSTMLTEQGYRVRKAINGSMAFKSVQTTMPDLILLDINMPDMNGYEVCKHLKADRETSNIPIIFISALDEALDKVKAFDVGGIDYITKPFQLEEVLARVKNHLTIQRQQKLLAEQNALLKEEISKRQQTETALIQSGKMAALGQLIAGIAHEVNTPLGAIRASISNIISALDTSLEQLPKLLQQLSPNQIADFLALIDTARNNQQPLSSREERQLRRSLKKELETQGFSDADTLANTLVLMSITTNVNRFLPLLNDRHKDLILEVATSISSQIRNSENILQAVERASKIVFALKSYAHRESAEEMVRANIAQGIDIVLTLYQNQFKQGIDVVREYEQVPEILCYPEQLNQVWTNLIHNAIQAMNNQGQLEIKIFSRAGEVVVQITDSGCGIPPEIKQKIFQPFFTTKPAGEGSGLGLDIVQKIINLHQGKIEVESQPGRTTFSVSLPLK